MNDGINTLEDHIETLRLKGTWPLTLKLFLSLGLIGVVVYFVDLQELLEAIGNLNPWYLLPVVVLIYLDKALMAYKWGCLLRAVGIHIRFLVLFRTYLVACLSAVCLPSTIGGDIFRAYSLSRFKGNTKIIFASIIVERVIGIVVLLVVVLVSLGLAFFLMKDSWVQFSGIRWFLILVTVFTISMVVCMSKAFREFVAKLAARFREESIVHKGGQLYMLCCEYLKRWRVVVIVSAWTLLEQLMPIFWNFLIVRAIDINVSLLQLFAVIPVIVLGSRLPISVNGFGIQEGLYVGLLGLVGVSTAQALLLSTLLRGLILLSALPWGLHYLMTGRQSPFPN